jgi:limonene-1,2-epoxide hydrolase
MNESPEAVVRSFLNAWRKPELDELVGFFSDDAVYTDGPRGEHRGIAAIRSEFETGMSTFPGLDIEVRTLVADRSTVMVERADNFQIAGHSFQMKAVGVFEVDRGRIKRWRDYYDVKSIADQIEAAGITLPG